MKKVIGYDEGGCKLYEDLGPARGRMGRGSHVNRDRVCHKIKALTDKTANMPEYRRIKYLNGLLKKQMGVKDFKLYENHNKKLKTSWDK